MTANTDTSLTYNELFSRCLKLTIERDRYKGVLETLAVAEMGVYPSQYQHEVRSMCREVLAGKDVSPPSKMTDTYETLAKVVKSLSETVDMLENIQKTKR